ncbi:MAG: GNAT family N-acetyltransferase [Candidatus Omnitrophica bacterium]|nr:GNAT family N-acetyltransferase [Candidatus Omnitrophota bacterium]
MKKKILFRCDGGAIPEIGTGHVVRCLALAKGLIQEPGTQVAFATRSDAQIAEMIRQAAYPCYEIKEDEPAGMVQALQEFKPDIVVLDLLKTAPGLMELIKKNGAILIALDEYGNTRDIADFLINPIIPNADALYQGFDYMVFPHTLISKQPISDSKTRVFASFGGYDHEDLSRKVLEKLMPLPDSIHLDVVVGRLYPRIQELRKAFEKKGSVEIHQNPANYQELISKSKIAIVSGGLTLFEAAAAGIPCIVVPQYEHQQKNGKRIEELGAGICLKDSREALVELPQILNHLIQTPDLYRRIEKRGRQLFDGLGNKRVSDLIGVIRYLDWDSQFFRVKIAYLAPKRIRESILKFAFLKCEEESVECLYYLCDCHDSESVRLAERNGFHFTDIRLTFERDIADWKPLNTRGPSEIVIRECLPEDLKMIQKIAEDNYQHSRYYFDHHFSKEICQKFYSDWVSKSSRGEFDDLVFVVSSDRKIIGFICCKRVSNNLGRIGLIGVDRQRQAQGVGIGLVEKACEWFHNQGILRVEVVTQGRNLPAQKFYQKCGFQIARSEIWYHKWFQKNYRAEF